DLHRLRLSLRLRRDHDRGGHSQHKQHGGNAEDTPAHALPNLPTGDQADDAQQGRALTCRIPRPAPYERRPDAPHAPQQPPPRANEYQRRGEDDDRHELPHAIACRTPSESRRRAKTNSVTRPAAIAAASTAWLSTDSSSTRRTAPRSS